MLYEVITYERDDDAHDRANDCDYVHVSGRGRDDGAHGHGRDDDVHRES